MGVAAATAAPLVSAKAMSTLEWLQTRRQSRQAHALQWAADMAGLDPDELQRRCEADPRLEELLLVVMDG